jgi:hypothetical protein
LKVGIPLAGATLTAAWANIADPLSRDWIGLYQVGAPDSATS